MSKRINGPCWECPVREEGCHGKCGTYLDWKKKDQEQKKEHRKGKEADAVLHKFANGAKYRRIKKQLKG